MTNSIISEETINWLKCEHSWSGKDSQFTNEYFTIVVCEKCKCPGEQNNVTSEVIWPAT